MPLAIRGKTVSDTKARLTSNISGSLDDQKSLVPNFVNSSSCWFLTNMSRKVDTSHLQESSKVHCFRLYRHHRSHLVIGHTSHDLLVSRAVSSSPKSDIMGLVGISVGTWVEICQQGWPGRKHLYYTSSSSRRTQFAVGILRESPIPQNTRKAPSGTVLWVSGMII